MGLTIRQRAPTTTTTRGVYGPARGKYRLPLQAAIAPRLSQTADIAEKDLWEAARVGRDAAKRAAPVKTGKLRNSIRRRRQERVTTRGRRPEVVITTSVYYSAWQNFGFRHYISRKWIKGKFYMQKGARAARGSLKRKGY